MHFDPGWPRTGLLQGHQIAQNIAKMVSGNRYNDSVSGSRIEIHPCGVDWHHKLWPWLTLNLRSAVCDELFLSTPCERLSSPGWTNATRFLRVSRDICRTDCSPFWMLPLGLSTRVGHRNTRLHCSGNCTGYAYRSESSFGCVFWRIIVCMTQHRRI